MGTTNTTNQIQIDLVHELGSDQRIARLLSGYCTNLNNDLKALCRQYIGTLDIKSNTEWLKIEEINKLQRAQEAKRLKIVVVGAGAVGKTSTIRRKMWDMFDPAYDPLIEDYYAKRITVDDIPIEIEMIDTYGQEEFACLSDEYLRCTDCFLWMYSIVDVASFYHLQTYLDRQQLVCDMEDVDEWRAIKYGVICGNKCDLERDRCVAYEEGKKLAEAWGPNVTFMEISAKHNINLNEAVQECVRMYRKRLFPQPQDTEQKHCCFIL